VVAVSFWVLIEENVESAVSFLNEPSAPSLDSLEGLLSGRIGAPFRQGLSKSIHIPTAQKASNFKALSAQATACCHRFKPSQVQEAFHGFFGEWESSKLVGRG
jgi:hypothetical protein